MYETQLESDFKEYLTELSLGVVRKFGRWLETEGGDANGGDFCVDCVEAVARQRKRQKNPYHHIHGWDDAQESDSVPHCEKCGILLEHSPTEYCIESDIEWLSEAKEIDAEGAAIILNWLSGMGCYSREKHWPLVVRHVKRFMRKAKRPVVPDGWLTWIPAETLSHGSSWFREDTYWHSLYQHLHTKRVQFRKKNGLNDTEPQGCRNREMSESKDPYSIIREMLRHTGSDNSTGRFLASIGIESTDDEIKPIRFRDFRGHLPDLRVRGLRMKKSPNPYHKKAVVLTHATLYFSGHEKAWYCKLYYDYNHYDSSSWAVEIKSKDLRQLSDAVDAWIAESVEPCDERADLRIHFYESWDETYRALDRVLSFEISDREKLVGLTDHVKKHGAIRLTPDRLRILKRWCVSRKQGAAKKR